MGYRTGLRKNDDRELDDVDRLPTAGLAAACCVQSLNITKEITSPTVVATHAHPPTNSKSPGRAKRMLDSVVEEEIDNEDDVAAGPCLGEMVIIHHRVFAFIEC